MYKIKFIILNSFLISLTFAKLLTNIDPTCDEIGVENSCIFSKVEMDPCEEVLRRRDPHVYCTLERKKNAHINFEFTPNFDADGITTNLYWHSNIDDIPFPGMDHNGCNYTTCPIKAGKSQQLKYSMYISELYPTNFYIAKWELVSNNDKSKKCCFLTRINLPQH